MKDQELVNTHRLSDDEEIYLRQLFQFSVIPHYVLIDKDGKVANADYSMGSLKTDI
ncbi:MAG: hypothetical protein PHI48_08770 [Bacteroidales bacterium]|nr:hypothetical protein [Bacteroidales bacterium]